MSYTLVFKDYSFLFLLLFIIFVFCSCSNFVEEKLGSKYIDGTRTDLTKCYEESGPATPVFFILSPGVDPLKDVETLGKPVSLNECYCAALTVNLRHNGQHLKSCGK